MNLKESMSGLEAHIHIGMTLNFSKMIYVNLNFVTGRRCITENAGNLMRKLEQEILFVINYSRLHYKLSWNSCIICSCVGASGISKGSAEVKVNLGNNKNHHKEKLNITLAFTI